MCLLQYCYISLYVKCDGSIVNKWTYKREMPYSQLAHLPWTTMGLFPVFLCITNTCSMTAMMAGGEVHRPSGVQQDIWN